MPVSDLFLDIIEAAPMPCAVENLIDFIYLELDKLPEFKTLHIFKSDDGFYFQFGITSRVRFGPYDNELKALEAVCDF